MIHASMRPASFRLPVLIVLVGYSQTTAASARELDVIAGWATAEGGTTGGHGGPTVTVSNASEMVDQTRGDEPRIIHIIGRIVCDQPVRIGRNKSLIGQGPGAGLAGGGLQLAKTSNIIVRNLSITAALDAVSIEQTHHIWIDHCTLFDCRDGLLDIKRGSDFVTVSWNHFHHHHKTSLVGHSDKPDIRALDTGHLRVTYHHNFFDGTNSRHPRVRFADPVHVFNNYFLKNAYGIAALMDSGVLVEGNCFEDVQQPTLTRYGDSPDPGRLVERKNQFIRSGKPEVRGMIDESRLTYRYQLDDASQVAILVRQGAGAGRNTAARPTSD